MSEKISESYWKMQVRELERENRRLKIWLDQYEADATELIEEHGADPSDKIDREVLKQMLNCLIGKNRTLTNKSKELEGEIEVQKRRVILSESQNYCKICGNILDGYVPPRETNEN